MEPDWWKHARLSRWRTLLGLQTGEEFMRCREVGGQRRPRPEREPRGPPQEDNGRLPPAFLPDWRRSGRKRPGSDCDPGRRGLHGNRAWAQGWSPTIANSP